MKVGPCMYVKHCRKKILLDVVCRKRRGRCGVYEERINIALRLQRLRQRWNINRAHKCLRVRTSNFPSYVTCLCTHKSIRFLLSFYFTFVKLFFRFSLLSFHCLFLLPDIVREFSPLLTQGTSAKDRRHYCIIELQVPLHAIMSICFSISQLLSLVWYAKSHM